MNILFQGLLFLHNSELGCHGNFKSSNCVVNSRWTLQVSDFALLEIRAKTYRKEDEHAYYRSNENYHFYAFLNGICINITVS